MDFKIIGDISAVETIATGTGVRERSRLRKMYGGARWRKLKGVARVQLPSGRIRMAEVHWMKRTASVNEN